MISSRLRIFIIFLLSICLLGILLINSQVCADEADRSERDNRTAAWYNTRYGRSSFGGAWMIGRFGLDSGLGEQGINVQFQTLFGGSASYRNTGFGMGFGGSLSGYREIYSPLADVSYGSYAYGGNPQFQSNPSWGTEGIMSGSLFGPNVNYYSAQPGMKSLLFGMLGGGLYAGYGGLGLGGYGMGGYGGLGLGGYGMGGWW